MTALPIATQFPGHGCIGDLTLKRSFDSLAWCVIDVFGLFWHVMHGCFYHQALADVWSTCAGIKYLYYTSTPIEWSPGQGMGECCQWLWARWCFFRRKSGFRHHFQICNILQLHEVVARACERVASDFGLGSIFAGKYSFLHHSQICN